MSNKSYINRLKHLAEILKNMDEYQAKIILSGLDKDVFDRRALQYLARQLFSPTKLCNELTNDELAFILKPLKMDTLAGIIFKIDKKNRKRCVEILGKKRYADILNHERAVSPAAVMDALLMRLTRGVGAGTIAYNGIALLLTPAPCRRSGRAPKKKESILFQTINPIISPGEGVKILIHAPEHPNRHVRLSLQGSGRRFFDEDTFTHVTLDDRGFYLGDVFPREVPGPVTLWLELPGGEVCRTVFFSQTSRACYFINILAVNKISGGRKVISFRLEGNNNHRHDEKVRVLLFCSRCGIPISLGFAEMGTIGHFEFIEPSGEKAHPHDYYLHIFADGHQAGLRFNAHSFYGETIPLSTENYRIAGDDVTIDLPVESHERILYHVSTSQHSDRALRHLIESGSMELEGVHQSPGGRKASPLEISLLHGEITLLAERRGMRTAGDLIYMEREGYAYHPNGIENISDLYFTLYRITSDGIVPMCRHISHLKREPRLLPLCPKYLESGEEVEIDVAYYLPEGGRLTIDGGKHRSLTGAGVFPLRINAEKSTCLELGCEGYSTQRRKITVSSRIEKQKNILIEYAPPGTVISTREGGSIELFASPGSLYQYLLKKLLTYPWGCAEQTSAKIAGYCLELLKESGITEDKIYTRSVKSGIKHLLTFKNREGFFSIFGHDHGPEATAVVLANLAPLMPYRDKVEPLFPELIGIIDMMKEKLKQSTGNEQMETTTHYVPYVITPDNVSFNATAILKNTHHNLQLKHNAIKLISQGFYSLSAYCCTVTAALIEEERNSITVFSGRRRTGKKMHRSGFPGLLEKLHILPPRLITREEIRGTELENAMDYLLKAISFAHPENSYPSTVEIVAMLRLLSTLKERINAYAYRTVSKELTVEEIYPISEAVEIVSPFTWIRRIVKSTPANASRHTPTVNLSSRFLRRGQIVTIQFASNAVNHEIYHFLLPAVLAATASSKHRSLDQSVITYPCGEGVLNLRAEYRGKGYLRLLVENMYNPAQTYVLNLGLVEVV